MGNRDVFICHASEDKDEIVRPMVEALDQAGITCWFDEAEIKWGDSITQKVNQGLKISKYVIVIFSKTFLNKKWPQRELNAVLNMEASTGEIKVLPLIVGSEQEQAGIITEYPLLNDKRYLPWDGKLNRIVNSLLTRLGKEIYQDSGPKSHRNIGLRIPFPKLKKDFTQHDKDIFLRDTFSIVKTYFEKALHEVEKAYDEIQTDLMEIHNYKFISTIYVRGEIKSRCKIWLGGLTGTDAIAYQSGQFNIESDNSFNDLLSVEDDGQSLGFRAGFFPGYNKSDNLLNPEQVSEYLWRRFTDNLE